MKHLYKIDVYAAEPIVHVSLRKKCCTVRFNNYDAQCMTVCVTQ